MASPRLVNSLHAYVMMGNHYHLLLETPEPNLVVGMLWVRRSTEQEAERLVQRAMNALNLSEAERPTTKKSDQRKILIGALIRRRTVASNGWIAQRLWTGDSSRVGRYRGNSAMDADRAPAKRLAKLEKMSICQD